jgi:hypothetical protein
VRRACLFAGLVLTSIAPAACDGQIRFDDVALDAGEGDAAADATTAGPCAVDTDCPLPSLHCDAVSGACVACTLDTHCAAPRPRCDAALNRCVECGASADCAAGLGCEPTTHRCVPLCGDDVACPASAPLCNRVRGFCMQCHHAEDCPGGASDDICDLANGICTQCVDDTQCPHDVRRCDRTLGRCVRCESSADCAAGHACDPLAHTCT